MLLSFLYIGGISERFPLNFSSTILRLNIEICHFMVQDDSLFRIIREFLSLGGDLKVSGEEKIFAGKA